MLAVIGKIIETAPIDGADRIHQAVAVCGAAGRWTGVVGKDLMVGATVLVFLQDAILPPSERWAFMERHHWRVRMARFRGCPSECVIVPAVGAEVLMQPGHDYTAELGVTKYVKVVPASLAGEAAGDFPSFIPKTDEPNFQTIEGLETLMDGTTWVARLKYDGSSCTVWKDIDGNLHVASRTLERREFDSAGRTNAYWTAARKYNFDNLPYSIALQFEVIGPGIQKNPCGLREVEGRAFTAFNYLTQRRLSDKELTLLCESIGIPVAQEAGLIRTYPGAEGLRKLAQQVYPNGKHAEGVVLRTLDQQHSFKVINLLYKD